MKYFFILLSIFYFSESYARVEHVSLNQKMFMLGDLPLAKVNIVISEDSSIDSGIEFYLVQKSGEEKLIVQQLNKFSLLLMGLDKVTDENAKIVVREWRNVKDIQLIHNEDKQDDNRLALKVLSSKVVLSDETNINLTKETAECVLNYDGQETLWRLGLNYGNLWGVNNYAAMLAIFHDNLHAFSRMNIKGLKKDAFLKCPSEETLDMYKLKRDAKEIFNKMLGE
ncbi:hypothetical protein ACE02U_07630 [Shewanella xiamenensis]|uniref:hypothetical protein n=1 Tax=Shewanella xiamenensis TaxID=332186 RepID=UPI0035B732EF